MATIQIQVDSLGATGALSRLQEAVAPGTILLLVKARLLEYVDESFRTRGRGRWSPLAPNTLLLRKRGGDMQLQDTGGYKLSFVSQSDERTFVEVGTNKKTASGAPLGKIHEEGTGPYTIRVRNARVLAARTRAGAWLIFGKEVNHPGVPARPVLPASVQEAENVLRPTIEGALRRVNDGR